MKIIVALCIGLFLAACSATGDRGNHPKPCDPRDPTTCHGEPGFTGEK